MANDNNDFVASISAMMETAGKIGQMQMELVSKGTTEVMKMIEPMTKTAVDLIGNASNSLGQIVQSLSDAIKPKQ